MPDRKPGAKKPGKDGTGPSDAKDFQAAAAITIQARARGQQARRSLARAVAGSVRAQQPSPDSILLELDKAWLRDRREMRQPGYVNKVMVRQGMRLVPQQPRFGVLTQGALLC